jgi:cytochrome o ubiquinol oxidase subunit 3
MSSPAATATLDHHHDPTTATGIPNKKLLMWAFLASDCMFFGTLISTHLI